MVITVTGSNDIHNWILAAKVRSAINPEKYVRSWNDPNYSFLTTAIELVDPTVGESYDLINLWGGAQLGVLASHVGSSNSYYDDYDVTGLFMLGGGSVITQIAYGTAQYYEPSSPIAVDRQPTTNHIKMLQLSDAGLQDNYQAFGINATVARLTLQNAGWDIGTFLEAAKSLRKGNGAPLESLLDADAWVVNGTGVANLIFGHANNDTLSGNGGNDFLSGGGGDDSVDGGADNDDMSGGDGNDTLFGDSGNDIVTGGTGNDLVMGGRGNDTVEGGDGNDELWGHEDTNIIRGRKGDDTFRSFENGTNDVNGNDGNDRYVLGDGADTIRDDSGYDTIQFSSAASADWISGTWLADAGNDFWDPTLFERYELTAGADTLVMNNDFLTSFSIIGGAGGDFVIGGGAADLIWGDAGNDRLQGQNGDDALSGGEGNDNIIGDVGKDRLRGGFGNDNLNGGKGLDTAEFDDHLGTSGGWTIDLIAGKATTQYANILLSLGDIPLGQLVTDGISFDQELFITETDTLTDIESIIASNGSDTIQAKEGTVVSSTFAPKSKPLLDGAGGADTLILSPTITNGLTVSGTIDANDVVVFKGRNEGSVETATALRGGGTFIKLPATGYLDFQNIETLNTGVGNDSVTGSAFRDTVNLGDGADKAKLGGGQDFVAGGAGADTLDGGGGADRFIYTAVTDGADIITNFEAADFFVFRGSAFGGLAAGALNAANFWSSKSGRAHDADDRFMFKTSNDTLWYDADGNGSAARIKIADLSNDFALTAADILIV
jgi:Ca2+-binding RTX toxin-like protein